MSKYTPGPWTFSKFGTSEHGKIKSEKYTIATVDCRYGAIGEPEANVHLIAAAPELLETLDYLRKELRAAQAYICQPKEIETWLDDMEERARVVIAKAKGES